VGVERNYFSNLRVLKEARVHRESFKYIENRLNYLRERETTIWVRVNPKS
jgi:RIO-like serine/threonine protein kinase